MNKERDDNDSLKYSHDLVRLADFLMSLSGEVNKISHELNANIQNKEEIARIKQKLVAVESDLKFGLELQQKSLSLFEEDNLEQLR